MLYLNECVWNESMCVTLEKWAHLCERSVSLILFLCHFLRHLSLTVTQITQVFWRFFSLMDSFMFCYYFLKRKFCIFPRIRLHSAMNVMRVTLFPWNSDDYNYQKFCAELRMRSGACKITCALHMIHKFLMPIKFIPCFICSLDWTVHVEKAQHPNKLWH